jgi:arylsulfatase A-like enzyme
LAEVLAARGYATAGFAANWISCRADYGLARGFIHYEDSPVSPLEVLLSIRLGELLVKSLDLTYAKVGEVLGEERLLRVFGDGPATGFWSWRRRDAAQINRRALDWMSAQGGRPFFAFLNYYDAHNPYVPPRGAARRFGLRLPLPQEHLGVQHMEGAQNAKPPASTIKANRDCYDDCIAYIDDQLGRLFDQLDRTGLLENTIIVITSDHGEHFGEHAGQFGHGSTLYAQEIRVPLLVMAPQRVPSRRIISAPVSLRDLPATVLDLVGLGRESPFPGRSLLRFWEPDAPGDPSSADPVFAESENEQFPLHDKMRTLQSVSFKEMSYIRNAQGGEELYDLTADPAEHHNLAGSPDAGPVLKHLRATLERFGAEKPDLGTPGQVVDPSRPPSENPRAFKEQEAAD